MANKEKEEKYGVAWQADDDVQACPLCEGEFGVFKRKHHCRFCGLVICADCMKHKAAHPKTQADEQICDMCTPDHENICKKLCPESDEDEGLAAAKSDEKPSREQQLRTLFAMIDVNGSGELEVSELKSVFGEHQHGEFLCFLDNDEDKKISINEWVDGIVEFAKELVDEEFQTDWVERMETCIADRPEAQTEEAAGAEAENEAVPEVVPEVVPVMSYKEFISTLSDDIDPEDAQKQYKEYKAKQARGPVMSYKEFISTLSDDIEPEEAQKQYKEYKSKQPKEEEPVVPDPDLSEKFGVAWQPDAEPNNCPQCSVEFGVFTRKHHCRFCGLIACADCSDHKEEHPMTKTNEKCCDQCFAIFQGERAAMAEDEEEEPAAPEDQSEKYGVEWQADDEVAKCTVCDIGFGVFTRKHHCRFCGKIVCAGCNQTKAVHPKTDSEESQCIQCVDKAKVEAEKIRLGQRTSNAEL